MIWAHICIFFFYFIPKLKPSRVHDVKKRYKLVLKWQLLAPEDVT